MGQWCMKFGVTYSHWGTEIWIQGPYPSFILLTLALRLSGLRNHGHYYIQLSSGLISAGRRYQEQAYS